MTSFSNIVFLGHLLSSLMGVIRSQENPLTYHSQNQYKVVCYLGTWAYYRPGEGKFVFEDIDPLLCTHAAYAFAKLQNNQITPFDPYLDLKENYGLGGYERFNNLKKKNPNLKTLISIGGWNEGSTKYSAMAADPNARATFVKSVVNFCSKYGFNGLDVDWEYPANRGGAPHDKQNFVTLLKELKEAFAQHGLLLSAAVSAGKNTIDTAYDIPGVAKYLDFINVMTYDFHGSWERTTGHSAPLYPGPGALELSVDYAIKYWVNNGAPKSKIILGMGTYGRSFTLANASNNGLGAPSTGPGTAGPFTRQAGTLGYNEICRDKGWTEVFAENIQAPYAYKGNQWVGYDSVKSIGIKVDYLIQNGLGGGMIWSLETDDFRGSCGGGKYPLLTTIASKLKRNRQTQDPTPKTIKQPISISTTTHRRQEFRCTKEGFFRDPTNCSVFYHCKPRRQKYFYKYTFNCPGGTAFDTSLSVCISKNKVPECT